MVNKILLIGRLGKDPEMRSTANGMSVLNFSMATTEKYKNEVQTTWHRVIVWGKHAEAIYPYLKKGGLVYCEGKLIIRDYEDKSGQKRQAVEVVAHTIRLLGEKEKQEFTNQSYIPAKGSPYPNGNEDEKEHYSLGSNDDVIPF
jgi:single-strand DNA-binding protein